MEIIGCEDACRVLDIENIDISTLDETHAPQIVNIFFDIIEREDVIHDAEQILTIIQAKNHLLFEIIKNKSTNKKLFELNINIHNKCKYCKGGGIKPVQEIGVVEKMDKCPDCFGIGIQHKPCKECYQTGWVGGKLCTNCHGKKRILFRKDGKKKCSRCHGERFVDRKVTTGRILTFINCTVCKGYGQIGWLGTKS